jgi:hypothetical protein
MNDKTIEEYLNLLKETILFYKHNPRGTTPIETGQSICVYHNKDNNTYCAVGRCLHPNKLNTIHDTIDNLIYEYNDDDAFQGLFKQSYRGYQPHFWTLLQFLHDNKEHWTPNNSGGNNLTEEGIKVVLEIEYAIEGLFNWSDENAFENSLEKLVISFGL